MKPTEEMNCLQEHFEQKEFKDRYGKCYTEVERFTQVSSMEWGIYHGKMSFVQCPDGVQGHQAEPTVDPSLQTGDQHLLSAVPERRD